jgi:hypothetical protein
MNKWSPQKTGEGKDKNHEPVLPGSKKGAALLLGPSCHIKTKDYQMELPCRNSLSLSLSLALCSNFAVLTIQRSVPFVYFFALQKKIRANHTLQSKIS